MKINPDSTYVLGFDIGGTKTAWGLFDKDGNLERHEVFPTPTTEEEFLYQIKKVVSAYPVQYVGIGLAGTISANHEDIYVCPHIPSLSHSQLAHHLEEEGKIEVIIDNDARCALIGEAWKGAARDFSSAVMLTLGTGVGGAVMQKGKVLPHPTDIQEEIGRLLVDPSDVFPADSGPGTVEAFLGGINLEDRFQIDMATISKEVRQEKPEAIEIWQNIADFFLQCLRTVYDTYSCRTVIIGGKGVHDLEYYLANRNGSQPPCPVIPAKLEELAGIYGAARLALDMYEEETEGEWSK